MEIFIKSFNRPYHLDRCLYSIFKYVSGFNKIIILDDGTPKRYLDKLQEKYPQIEIKRSEFYCDKSEAIENDTIERSKLKFPGKFWYQEISAASDYFLLLEDDFFIIHPIELTSVEQFMKSERVFQYKLLWQGRKEFNLKEIKSFDAHELIVTKNWFYSSENFRRLSHDKYRVTKLINNLAGKNSYFKYFILPFYKNYTVAGAVLNKALFMEMWKDVDNLNEFTQIYRMLRFYQENSMPLKVGKAATESRETSYLTSATNEFKDVNLSIFEVNKILNKAWLNGEFDANYKFPQDHGITYLKSFLPAIMHNPYTEWVKHFSGAYRNYGCRVIID